jgi:phosphate acetyltransferase
MSFIEEIIQRAKENPKKIVFPEGEEDRILRAVHKIKEEKIAVPIILGNPDTIRKRAEILKLSLDGVEIIDIQKSEKIDQYSNLFFELRKHKGMTLEHAKSRLQRYANYFGTLMVKAGDADGMVTGAIHTSAESIRPALEIIKTREGAKFVSGAFFMTKGENVLLFADIALIAEPDAEQLADIAKQSAHTFEYFTNERAKIALLSFSTKHSAETGDVGKIRQALDIIRKTHPWMIIDGELQADAALVPRIAEFKCHDSPIKGDANVLIFPNLAAGNIGAKLVEHLGSWQAIGPFLQGLAKPVSDLSRGSTVDEIIKTTACIVVEAQRGPL